ncbi:MAG: helix-turn-helix transcriptional regulator [Bacteroidales bacterium]|jgi:plasmid maintenance system antidote protein VapI|nr:helix-turn-helix transcriptional regulator [Bacteroidales bacterium]
MQPTNTIHIGKLIKAELEAQGRTKVWLAGKVGCSRVNIHRILNNENIDLALLCRISRVLGVNFLRVIANQIDEEIQ